MSFDVGYIQGLDYAGYQAFRGVLLRQLGSLPEGGVEQKELIRWLCRNDRFYLCEMVLRATEWIRGIAKW